MKTNIQLVELINNCTAIDSWNEDSDKINDVVRAFNKVQTDYRHEPYQMEIVQAKINLIKKTSGEYTSLQDWQLPVLYEMQEFIDNNYKDKKDTDKVNCIKQIYNNLKNKFVTRGNKK